jgi:hypothetical protein
MDIDTGWPPGSYDVRYVTRRAKTSAPAEQFAAQDTMGSDVSIKTGSSCASIVSSIVAA